MTSWSGDMSSKRYCFCFIDYRFHRLLQMQGDISAYSIKWHTQRTIYSQCVNTGFLINAQRWTFCSKQVLMSPPNFSGDTESQLQRCLIKMYKRGVRIADLKNRFIRYKLYHTYQILLIISKTRPFKIIMLSNSVQILFKFCCSNFVQILFKFCSNSVQILFSWGLPCTCTF